MFFLRGSNPLKLICTIIASQICLRNTALFLYNTTHRSMCLVEIRWNILHVEKCESQMEWYIYIYIYIYILYKERERERESDIYILMFGVNHNTYKCEISGSVLAKSLQHCPTIHHQQHSLLSKHSKPTSTSECIRSMHQYLPSKQHTFNQCWL